MSSWVACIKVLVSSPNLFWRLMKARGPGTAWPGGGASSSFLTDREERDGNGDTIRGTQYEKTHVLFSTTHTVQLTTKYLLEATVHEKV
jgi:hypothetical protein